ncbi:MAG: pantoate--beta-alanine ligase [Flavobacteriales bacterium]|nr:pantoate--beta-alanine ligase [Flavobacteriales bacterium]
MQIITTANDMSAFCQAQRASDRTIGFVPTMGALHAGHISLVETAKRTCDVVIVSIFVNPTQFNDPNDLAKYPRTFEADSEMLREAGVDAVFYPSVDEVYPSNEASHYELDGLDALMEGPNRPGHFNGVVQVVTRFFDIIQPDKAFFGEKDFQQLAIIRHTTRKLGYATEIVGCPTMREQTGLAMSSRNMRLSEHGKQTALGIFRSLEAIRKAFSKGSEVSVAASRGREILLSQEGMELEYLELVNSTDLQRADDETTSIRACIAAYVEGVRLIDNMEVK